MLRSLPDLNIKQNRTRVTINIPCILYRTRSVYPCILYGRPADQSGYLFKLYPDPHDQCSTSRSWLRLVSWHSFDWLALQGKERSSTNWEWLEKAGLIQDTRPHLSWDRTTFFFIGSTRPHLLITTFNFWPTPSPPGSEGPICLRYLCDRNH